MSTSNEGFPPELRSSCVLSDSSLSHRHQVFHIEAVLKTSIFLNFDYLWVKKASRHWSVLLDCLSLIFADFAILAAYFNMAPTAVVPATESNNTATLKKPLGSDTSVNDQKSRKNEEDVDAEGDDDGEDEVVGEVGE